MNTDKIYIATENAAVLGMDICYDRLFRHVFTPILDCYGVLPQDRPYIMAFHAVLLAPPPGEWYNFLTSTSLCFTGFEIL